MGSPKSVREFLVKLAKHHLRPKALSNADQVGRKEIIAKMHISANEDAASIATGHTNSSNNSESRSLLVWFSRQAGCKERMHSDAHCIIPLEQTTHVCICHIASYH
jgi:hypothetical protein